MRDTFSLYWIFLSLYSNDTVIGWPSEDGKGLSAFSEIVILFRLWLTCVLQKNIQVHHVTFLSSSAFVFRFIFTVSFRKSISAIDKRWNSLICLNMKFVDVIFTVCILKNWDKTLCHIYNLHSALGIVRFYDHSLVNVTKWLTNSFKR